MTRPIDDIADAFRDAIVAALKDREDELTRIAKAGGHEAAGGIFGDVGNLTEVIGNIVTVALLLDPPAEATWQGVKAVEGAGGHLGRGFGIGYFLGYAVWQLAQPAVLPIVHAINTATQTEIFDPATAAQLQAKNIINEDYGRNEAAGGNLSGEHYDKLVESAQTQPDVTMVFDMLSRGLIQEEDAATMIKRHGIASEWVDRVLTLRRMMLSPADVALASLRGFMTAEQAQSYAVQLGMNAVDFQTLIDNTGEPPGLMLMLEGYRRGFIDKPRLEHGIRESRVRDEWIGFVEQMRFEPMSTSDAVRAVVEHYLDDAEGAAIAQQNGLTPDHWRPLVDSWGRPLSHEQMMTLFHRGQATEDEVRQAFRESDLKDKYIDQAIELGRQLIPERTIVSMVDHGVITHDAAMAMLRERGYNVTDADNLIKLGVAQRSTSHKTLSKGDILAMYTDSLMNRATAEDHLAKLGYQPQDAVEMLDLADYKRKSSVLKALERGVEAAFRAHHLTEAQAISELTAGGLDHAQAQTLLDEWRQLRGAVTRTLSEAQVIKAIKNQAINLDDGRARLKALGLSAGDIEVIYKTEGFVVYEPAWHYPNVPPGQL